MLGATSANVPRSTSRVVRSRALTPMTRAPASAARATSSAVVHLDQRGHAEGVDPLGEAGEGGLVERRHDQQDEVGAVGPGLPHLVRRDHEVLAQHGDVDRRPHRGEVVEAAAEPALLGEHADHGGAPGLVVDREAGRVGDRGEGALAGAGPLHLGDHLDAAAGLGHRAAQRRDGVERGRTAGRELLQPLERDGLLPRDEVLADPGDDVVEDAHGWPARSRLATPCWWTMVAGAIPPQRVGAGLPGSSMLTAAGDVPVIGRAAGSGTAARHGAARAREDRPGYGGPRRHDRDDGPAARTSPAAGRHRDHHPERPDRLHRSAGARAGRRAGPGDPAVRPHQARRARDRLDRGRRTGVRRAADRRRAAGAEPDPYGQPAQADPYGQQRPYGQQQPDPYGQQAQAGPVRPAARRPTPTASSSPTASRQPYGQPAQTDPYGQQQGYGQQAQPYGAGAYGGYPAQGGTPSQGLAIGSLVCGVLAILTFLCGLLAIPLGIAAVVLGIVAMNKVKAGTGGGRGLALAGVICGGIGGLISIVLTVAAIATGNADFGSTY